MSVKRGRKFLNTPGPTHVPDRVMNAMHQPTLDLSDPYFLETTKFLYYFISDIQDFNTIEISAKTDSVSGFEWD